MNKIMCLISNTMFEGLKQPPSLRIWMISWG
jgi:hypothetical protein